MPSPLRLAPLLLALGLACEPSGGAHLSEAAGWLQGYLQIDTSNPPGNEHLAAAYLADILHREGISTQLLVTPEGRTNLYARLAPGEDGGEALVLLHHMDVVPPGEGWRVDPFAGEVRDGRLWGRGALDAKGLGIAQLAAVVDLKRRKVPLRREVILLAVADEESGGLYGTAWVLQHHPHLLAGVEAVLNEGGSSRAVGGRLLWWEVEVAQKRPLWVRVSAQGRGGHGSGFHPRSASHRLVAGLARILEAPRPWRVTPPVREYLAALAPHQNDHWRRVFSRIDEIIPPEGPREFLLPGMANLFVDSVQVTVVEAGWRINVIPTRASAELDIRLLPDTDADAFLADLKEAAGKDLKVEVLLSAPPSPPSPADHLAFQVVRQVLGEEAPVVPSLIPGFTDSRFFRERGIPAYGVSPFVLGGNDLRGIHGADESIPLAEFDRGVERMRRIVRAWATQ